MKRAAFADVLILHKPVVEATLFRECSEAANDCAYSTKHSAEAETTHKLLAGKRLLRLDIDLRVVTLYLCAVKVDNLNQREQQKGSKEDPLNCLQVLIVLVLLFVVVVDETWNWNCVQNKLLYLRNLDYLSFVICIKHESTSTCVHKERSHERNLLSKIPLFLLLLLSSLNWVKHLAFRCPASFPAAGK